MRPMPKVTRVCTVSGFLSLTNTTNLNLAVAAFRSRHSSCLTFVFGGDTGQVFLVEIGWYLFPCEYLPRPHRVSPWDTPRAPGSAKIYENSFVTLGTALHTRSSPCGKVSLVKHGHKQGELHREKTWGHRCRRLEWKVWHIQNEV